MPTKQANVKNTKQYEALKRQGDVEVACREDRQLPEGVLTRRQEVRERR
jgi:hypothetical protein